MLACWNRCFHEGWSGGKTDCLLLRVVAGAAAERLLRQLSSCMGSPCRCPVCDCASAFAADADADANASPAAVAVASPSAVFLLLLLLLLLLSRLLDRC